MPPHSSSTETWVRPSGQRSARTTTEPPGRGVADGVAHEVAEQAGELVTVARDGQPVVVPGDLEVQVDLALLGVLLQLADHVVRDLDEADQGGVVARAGIG